MIGLINSLSKDFSFARDAHSILIRTLFLCEVSPCFFNGDVDYCINLDMLFFNTEILQRLAIIRYNMTFWPCDLVLGNEYRQY